MKGEGWERWRRSGIGGGGGGREEEVEEGWRGGSYWNDQDVIDEGWSYLIGWGCGLLIGGA